MGLGGSGLSLGLSLGSTPFPHLGSSSAPGMGPGFGAQASAPLPLSPECSWGRGGLTPSAAAMAAINAAVHPSMTVAGAASFQLAQYKPMDYLRHPRHLCPRRLPSNLKMMRLAQAHLLPIASMRLRLL